MLEVCVDSLESALNAMRGGADELEVCSSLSEGGLTPSMGLVKEIIYAVHETRRRTTFPLLKKRPKVNVMLRCRPGSDFQYSVPEYFTMLSDLRAFKQLTGIDRFVFGALTPDLTVDEDMCKKFVKQASPIPLTFHRAFDICKDPVAVLDKVIDLGFSRILTSGKCLSAVDPEAVNLIKVLLEKSKGRIQIMPGAGLNSDNVSVLKDIGCEIFHGSCKTLKVLPEVGIAMGPNDTKNICVTDVESVKKFKEAIGSDSKPVWEVPVKAKLEENFDDMDIKQENSADIDIKQENV